MALQKPTSTSVDYAQIVNMENALFQTYDQVLHDVVSLEAGIFDLIPVATGIKAIGEQHIYKLEDGFNEDGVGTRDYDAAIPASHHTTQVSANISERALYAAVKIDLRSQARASGGGSILRDPALHEVTMAGKVAAKELARMVYGDGTGIRATTANAGSSATSMTLDKSGGARKSGRLYMRRNMSIDSYTDTSIGADKNRVTNVAKGTTTDTVTLTDAATWAVGDDIYKYDTFVTAKDNDWEGMEKAFDDGTLFSSFAGITVSGSDYWKGIRDASSTVRAFDPELLAKLLVDQRLNNGTGMTRQTIFSNLGQPFEYWKFMLPAFQTNIDKQGPKFDVGLPIGDEQPFMGIPWKSDVNCPFGALYVPDLANFQKWEMKGFGEPVMGLGNKGWTWDQAARVDAAETYRSMYGNFKCSRRDTQIMMLNLAENFLS